MLAPARGTLAASGGLRPQLPLRRLLWAQYIQQRLKIRIPVFPTKDRVVVIAVAILLGKKHAAMEAAPRTTLSRSPCFIRVGASAPFLHAGSGVAVQVVRLWPVSRVFLQAAVQQALEFLAVERVCLFDRALVEAVALHDVEEGGGDGGVFEQELEGVVET